MLSAQFAENLRTGIKICGRDSDHAQAQLDVAVTKLQQLLHWQTKSERAREMETGRARLSAVLALLLACSLLATSIGIWLLCFCVLAVL